MAQPIEPWRAGGINEHTTKIVTRLAYFVRMTLASVTSPFRENTSRRRLSSAPLGRFFTHSRDDMRARVAHHTASKRRGRRVSTARLSAPVEEGELAGLQRPVAGNRSAKLRRKPVVAAPRRTGAEQSERGGA